MCNDVDPKLTFFVLDEVDVSVDTLCLVPPRQFGCNKGSEHRLALTPSEWNAPMIVALACTPPTETVWKTNLNVRDQIRRSETNCP